MKSTTIEIGNTTLITTDRTYEVVTHNYTPPSYTKRVLLSQETTTHTEGTSSYETTKSFQYDGLGNVVIARDFGLTTTTVDDVVTCTTYKNDTGNWRLGYPASVRTGSSCTYTDAANYAEGSCSCTGELKRKHITYTPTFDAATVTEYNGATAARTTSYTYDVMGNVVTKTTPGLTAQTPVVETFTYDSFFKSFATSHTRSGGDLVEGETFESDPRFGAVTMKCDDNGNCMQRTYDGLGREVVTRLTSPTGALRDVARVIWATDANGDKYREEWTYQSWTSGAAVYERTFFDGFGRVRRILREPQAGSALTEILRTLDANGNVLTESVPHAVGASYANTVYQYDGLNRVTQVTLPTGAVTKVAYTIELGACTACSMRTTTTEGFGTSSARSYSRFADAHDRVRKQVDPEGRQTSFGFDALGRKTSILTLAGTTTTTYDGLDRIVSMTSPDRGTETYSYNAVSTWLDSVSAGGSAINYTYDGLGRVVTKSIPTESVHYTYDEASAANGQGHLTHVEVIPAGETEPSSSQSFTYTTDGRVATSTLTVDGSTYTLGSVYDPSGKLTAFTYPDGSVLTRTYHTSGDLAALIMGGVTYASYATYNAANQPLSITYGNGTATTYAYDDGLRLTDLTTTGPSGTLLNYDYTWDVVNQVRTIADQRDSTRSQTFTYSAAGYLKQAVSSMYGTLAYGYDASGNMTSKEGTSFVYTNNRVTSGTNFTAGYDARGNRISQTKGGVSKTFTYDRENHLRQVNEGTVVKNVFDYDFKGDRIVKVDADGTKTIYVGPNFEVTKFTDGRRIETKYVNGPSGRVAAVSNEIAAPQAALLDFERLDATGKTIDKASFAGLAAYAKNRLGVWSMHPRAPKGVMSAIALAFLGVFVQFLRSKRLSGRFAALRDRVREIVWPEGTAYAQRHPLFALAIPFVLMSFLSACSGKPVDLPEETESTASMEQALTAGANGYGYPVAGSYWFHQNHVGSSSVVTNASGVEVARAEYKPYGEIIQSVSPGLDIFRSKFTGKEWDKDSEVYFFEARSFDPFTGRFLSADTEIAGGPKHFAAAYNPYAYANNNPVVYNDPSGHFLFLAVIIVAVVVGAYAGGAAANGSWNAANWNFKSWKTWTGIGVGGLVGGLSAGMATGGLAGALAGVVIESAAMNGLKFLSPEGSNWKQFLIDTSIDIGIGVATIGAGAAWTKLRSAGVDDLGKQTMRMSFRQALAESLKPPGSWSELAQDAAKEVALIGLNIGYEESQKHNWFGGTKPSQAAKGAFVSATRFAETPAMSLARSFKNSVLRAAGFDENSGWLVVNHRNDSLDNGGSFGAHAAVY